MNERWEMLKKKYWPPKKDQLLILVLAGLLLAVIAVPAEKKTAKAPETASDLSSEPVLEAAAPDYGEQTEKKLEKLLESVEGVGQVRVMLIFEGSKEKQVEKDRETSGDGSSEETVYEDYGSSGRVPYVTAETNPRVDGVLVIAEGGGDVRIRQEILEAAQALFGIDAHKIKIMKMEGPK